MLFFTWDCVGLIATQSLLALFALMLKADSTKPPTRSLLIDVLDFALYAMKPTKKSQSYQNILLLKHSCAINYPNLHYFAKIYKRDNATANRANVEI